MLTIDAFLFAATLAPWCTLASTGTTLAAALVTAAHFALNWALRWAFALSWSLWGRFLNSWLWTSQVVLSGKWGIDRGTSLRASKGGLWVSLPYHSGVGIPRQCSHGCFHFAKLIQLVWLRLDRAVVRESVSSEVGELGLGAYWVRPWPIDHHTGLLREGRVRGVLYFQSVLWAIIRAWRRSLVPLWWLLLSLDAYLGHRYLVVGWRACDSVHVSWPS